MSGNTGIVKQRASGSNRGPFQLGVGRLRRRLGRPGTISAGVLFVLLFLAIFGSVIAPYDPNTTSLGEALLPPSLDHPFGTDGQGRDILSRLMVGARTGLLGPLFVVLLSTVIGVVPALLVTWRRGFSDALSTRGFDLILAFPGLLLAILAASVFGKGLTAASIAIAISYSPYVYRLVRSGVYRETAKPYVSALRSQGFGQFSIMGLHVLPNIGGLVMSQSTILFAYAIADLAAISFLGLGVQPPTPDWGAMVAGGLPDLTNGNIAESLAASLMIALTIICANVLGNSLEGGDAILTAEEVVRGE